MMHHQPETPLSRRIQRNSSGTGVAVGAGGAAMPTLFSPRKRTSTTSSTDEYSGTTLTLSNNDESEASDINDFDAFGLSSSTIKKPPSNDPFSPFEFSTANFETDTNFFATTELDNKQGKQQSFGNDNGFGAFQDLSQGFMASSMIPPPLDEDASLNDDDDDDNDDDCFLSPTRSVPRKRSSRGAGLSQDTRPNSTHGPILTTSEAKSGRNPPSHSKSASNMDNNRGVARRASRSHHARPDDEDKEFECHQASGTQGQRSEGDLKSKSQSRKGSSRKLTTSSHKPADEQPSPPTDKRSTSTKSSSQRSHSVGRRANAKSSGTKHRKSSNEVTASPSTKSNSHDADIVQQECNHSGHGRPTLSRSSSFSDRKARKSILKSDHNPNEEIPDSKNRQHRGRASEQDSALLTKRRSHSESRRTALATKKSGWHQQRRPSTSNPSDLDQATATNSQGRSFRRSAAFLEMSTPKKDEMDVLLSSPVSKGGSCRQERTAPASRSVGRFHSDIGKVVHQDGRRPSRRSALEATTGADEGGEMLSPGSKDSGSHSGRRAERFTGPQRSSSFVAAGSAFPPEDATTGLECAPFTLSRGNSFKRGSTRACRRTILKEDVFASPRATDTKGGVANRRLGGSIHSSNLANSTHTPHVAPGVGGVLGSPALTKKSPASSKRPVLERTPPAQSHSDSTAMRKREFDPRLDNLLQKLRDPSLRDLNPDKESGDDDDDVTAEGIPVNQQIGRAHV